MDQQAAQIEGPLGAAAGTCAGRAGRLWAAPDGRSGVRGTWRDYEDYDYRAGRGRGRRDHCPLPPYGSAAVKIDICDQSRAREDHGAAGRRLFSGRAG